MLKRAGKQVKHFNDDHKKSHEAGNFYCMRIRFLADASFLLQIFRWMIVFARL